MTPPKDNFSEDTRMHKRATESVTTTSIDVMTEYNNKKNVRLTHHGRWLVHPWWPPPL